MSKLLSWQDITVGMFLDIHKISTNKDLDDMERLEKTVCTVFDKTEKQVDDMPMDEFTRLSKQVAFVLDSDIPGKAVRTIKVNGKRFKITYDPTKLRHRQYVELIHFGDKPVENMHYIMASIVQPVTWFGKKLKNMSEDHEWISAAMLNARVIDVYHSCVFFCNLYINLITSIKGSLIKEMMSKGKSQTEASELISISINAMAGFIPPKSLRILKA